jgi:hypothetical protein
LLSTVQRSFTSGSVPQRIAEQPDMLRYGPTTGNGGGSALQLRRTSARQLKTPLGSSSSPTTPSVARIPPRPLELPPDVASLGLLPSGSARLQVRPRKAITVSGGNAPLLLNHPALANTNASASANGDSSEDGGSDDNDSSSGSGTTRKHSQLRSSGKSRLRNKSTLGFGLVASSRSGSAIERDASGSDRDRDTEEEERDQQSGNEPATDTADEEGVDQEAEKEWLDSFDDIPPYDSNDYDDSDDVGEVDSMASSRVRYHSHQGHLCGRFNLKSSYGVCVCVACVRACVRARCVCGVCVLRDRRVGVDVVGTRRRSVQLPAVW